MLRVGQRNPKDLYEVGDRIETFDLHLGRGTVLETNAVRDWPLVRLDFGTEHVFHPGTIRKLTPIEALAELAPKTKKNPRGFQVGDRVVEVHAAARARHGVGTVIAISKIAIGREMFVRFDAFPDDPVGISFTELTKITPLEELADLAPKTPTKKNPKGPFRIGDRVLEIYAPAQARRGVGTVIGLHERPFCPDVHILFDSMSYPINIHYSQLEKVNPLEELAALGKSKKNPNAFRQGDRVRHVDGTRGWDKAGVGTVENPIPVKGLILVRFQGQNGLRRVYSGHFVLVTPLEELAALAPKAKKNPISKLFAAGDRVKFKHPDHPKYPYTGTITGYSCHQNTSALGFVNVRFDNLDQDSECTEVWLRKLTPLEELAELAPKKAKSNGKGTLLPAGTRVLVRRPSRPRSGWLGTTHAHRLGSFQKVVFDDGYVAYIDPANWEIPGPLEELAATGKDNPKATYIEGQRVSVGRNKMSATVTERSIDGWTCVVLDVNGDNVRVRTSILAGLSPMEDLAKAGSKAVVRSYDKLKAKKNPKHSFQVGDRVIQTYAPARAKHGVGTVTRTEADLEHAGYVGVLFDTGQTSVTHILDLEHVLPLDELAALAPKKAKSRLNPKPIFLPGDRVRMCRNFNPKASDVIGTVQRDPLSTREPNIVSVQWDTGATNYTGRLHLVRVSPLEDLAALAPKKVKNNPGAAGEITIGSRVTDGIFIGTVQSFSKLSFNLVIRWDGGKIGYRGLHELSLVTPLEEMGALGRKTKKNPDSLIGRRIHMLRPEDRNRRGTIEATYNGGAQYYVKMDTGQVWRLYPHEVHVLTDLEVLAEAHRK